MQFSKAELPWFISNLILAAVLSYLLGRIYVRFGFALSNRDLFARNFVLLTTTTMLIITVVQSSLALSLGLVGALSIIRFRSAIKEPEELSFLFLAMAIGLGLGAKQMAVTVSGFVVLVGIIILKAWLAKPSNQPNLYLTINSESPGSITLPRIMETLQQHSSNAMLKRFDETPASVEACFLANFKSVQHVHLCTEQLRALGKDIKISFLEERGIGA